MMQRSAILGLLLACAVSLGSCAIILENGAPVLWAQTAGQLTDLPIHNGVVMPNPWNYLHRMSMLRLLIGATDPFMGSMGTNATDSPLWGLPLQLAWMLTSGELCVIYPTESSAQSFVDALMVLYPVTVTSEKCKFCRTFRRPNRSHKLRPAGSRSYVYIQSELVGL